MSKTYDNTNSGVLFRNEDKGDGDKRPDYTGKLNVEGEDYRLAAWVRESKAGTKFLSVKISEFKESAPRKQPDDDLPI